MTAGQSRRMLDGPLPRLPVSNTSKIGVWRIDTTGHYVVMGIADDPLAAAAAEQAPNN